MRDYSLNHVPHSNLGSLVLRQSGDLTSPQPSPFLFCLQIQPEVLMVLQDCKLTIVKGCSYQGDTHVVAQKAISTISNQAY